MVFLKLCHELLDRFILTILYILVLEEFLISLIIPTKNRPNDLNLAIKSLLQQSQMPDEIIVVDQSDNNKSKILFLNSFNSFSNIKIIYIHDKKIDGLVQAKKVGVRHATKDIICFIEDDIFLEDDYIEQLKNGFKLHPHMVGCCGIVTNGPNKNFIYHFIFNLFHIGIFNDKRISIFSKSRSNISDYLTQSDKLSGGISAWKKKVFHSIKFDTKNKFHMLEDIDFSFRVFKHFDDSLYINTKMRLAHFSSPINRNDLFDRYKNKTIEYFLFYKKNKLSILDFLNFSWLLFGMLLDSVFKCFIDKSFDPFYGYLKGFADGIKRKIAI